MSDVSAHRKSDTQKPARSAVMHTEALERRQLLATMTPFPVEKPAMPDETVLFANFDNGGENLAYHDTSKKNQGREYRRKERVDIEWLKDEGPGNIGSATGSGRGVSFTTAGEWLKYTIDVETSGVYRLDIRYSAREAGGTAHLAVDGQNVSGSLNLSSTSSWNSYRTLQKTGISLTAGTHVLKFVIDSGAGNVANLNWMRFVSTGTPNNTPPTDAAVAWPKSWQRVDNAPSPRFEAAGHSFGGKLYVFGGFKDSDFNVDRTYAVLDPNTMKWKSLGTLPKGMAETHVTPVDDGKYIYFVGGFAGDIRHDQQPTQIASNKIFRYDPAKNTWLQLSPSLPVARGAGATAIVNNKIHYISGNPSDRITNVADHYVLDLGHLDAGWKKAAPAPDPKDHPSTVVLNGLIYVLGGEYGHDRDAATQTSVHVYDPSTNKWKRLADMPLASGHAEGSTFAYNGKIIFAGGQTYKQAATQRVFSYDPSKNKWSELKSLPNYLQGAQVAVFGKKVIVALGARFTVNALAEVYVGQL